MKNLVPRVAAIHDLSGFGRSSLTVVIPILSTMGIQVCPLPTAVLSTHSKFSNYHFVDLTDHLEPILSHWQRLPIHFDGIYSGFLGSSKQIAIVEDMIDRFQEDDGLVLVDPVLGDDGELYGPFDHTMVKEMARLVTHAHVITPNLTEAAFLLGEAYPMHSDLATLKKWCVALSAKGPRIVIITGVPDTSVKNRTFVLAYNAIDKRFWRVSCDYLPASFPGTGDAFASIVVGCLIKGDSLPMALDRAVQFISMGVRATFGYPYDTREGILLERILPQLNAPILVGSYELLD